MLGKRMDIPFGRAETTTTLAGNTAIVHQRANHAECQIHNYIVLDSPGTLVKVKVSVTTYEREAGFFRILL